MDKGKGGGKGKDKGMPIPDFKVKGSCVTVELAAPMSWAQLPIPPPVKGFIEDGSLDSICISLQCGTSFTECVTNPTKSMYELGDAIKVTGEIKFTSRIRQFINSMIGMVPLPNDAIDAVLSLFAGLSVVNEMGYDPAKVKEWTEAYEKDTTNGEAPWATLAGLRKAVAVARKRAESDEVKSMEEIVKLFTANLEGIDKIEVRGAGMPFDVTMSFDNFDPFCVLGYVLGAPLDYVSTDAVRWWMPFDHQVKQQLTVRRRFLSPKRTVCTTLKLSVEHERKLKP